MDCIFCKILTGEVPSEKIYENNDVYAFLDLRPVNPGHTLVIPKEHYENIEELPEDLMCEMSKAVKIVGNAIKRGLGSKAYNLALNNGSVAGQVVPHVHFHIIPRVEGDGLKPWPQEEYAKGEMQEVGKKMRKALNF